MKYIPHASPSNESDMQPLLSALASMSAAVMMHQTTQLSAANPPVYAKAVVNNKCAA